MYTVQGGVTAVRSVIEETDPDFIRVRAWWSTCWRWKLGQPLNPDFVRLLVVEGGKSQQSRTISDTAA